MLTGLLEGPKNQVDPLARKVAQLGRARRALKIGAIFMEIYGAVLEIWQHRVCVSNTCQIHCDTSS